MVKFRVGLLLPHSPFLPFREELFIYDSTMPAIKARLSPVSYGLFIYNRSEWIDESVPWPISVLSIPVVLR
jgi:hypothetical protein